MRSVKFFVVVFVLIVTGCAGRRPVSVSADKKADVELAQKVEHILNKVYKIAQKNELDYLGRSTMSESVELMDMGAKVIPVLVEKLKVTDNWKLRFWIVDIMGYIPSKDNILPLIEVIEDNTEREEVRLRSCESLRELKYKNAKEHLLISIDIVNNKRVKEEINKTINYLR